LTTEPIVATIWSFFCKYGFGRKSWFLAKETRLNPLSTTTTTIVSRKWTLLSGIPSPKNQNRTISTV
jgi:hypothetical protein